jgi:threonine/homoserine/homoserine lactone efflux protein
MDLFVQGLIAGLALSFLVGPLFFMLIRIGIEHGFRATMIYCAGIWVSDLLYILFTYFGMSCIAALTKIDGFELYTGLIGGVLLMSFGIISMITKPPAIEQVTPISLFLKGFIINTLNPFTVFFWIVLSGKLSIEKGMSIASASIFYAGLYTMLIFTDAMKGLLAKKIQQRMTPNVLVKIRQGLGLALVICGIVLIVRVSWSFWNM